LIGGRLPPESLCVRCLVVFEGCLGEVWKGGRGFLDSISVSEQFADGSYKWGARCCLGEEEGVCWG